MTGVVQLVQHLRPGGLEQLALTLARFSKYQHQLISLDGEAGEALNSWPPLQALQPAPIFMGKPAGVSLPTIWQLSRLFRRLRPLAVHTHHIGPLLYGGLAARLAGVRVHVHTEHDAWHLRDPGARRLQALLLNLTRPRHVAVGGHVASELQRIWPQRRIATIANGVDTTHFAPGEQSACRQRLGMNAAVTHWLGCAARLETVKGVDVLLRAHAMAPATLGLAIAGTGSQARALLAQASQLGTADRVRFLGQLDDPRLLYGAVDVYCQPSRNEGLPLAPLEAQSSGVPTVITDVGAAAQISGWPGSWRVPSEDPAALHDAFMQALDCQASPRPAIVERFNIRHTAQQYDQAYAGSSA